MHSGPHPSAGAVVAAGVGAAAVEGAGVVTDAACSMNQWHLNRSYRPEIGCSQAAYTSVI